MVEHGLIRAGLVVAGESSRDLLETTLQHLQHESINRKNIKPHFASLTIGSGAAAALITHEDLADGAKIEGGTHGCSTEYSDLCQGGLEHQGGTSMQTNSEELMKRGIQLAQRVWSDFLQEMDWQPDTPQHTICHQVGSVHQRELHRALGLNPEKDVITFKELGNMGSVSLPITLAIAAEKGLLSPREELALLGIGSGISSLMLGMRWF